MDGQWSNGLTEQWTDGSADGRMHIRYKAYEINAECWAICSSICSFLAPLTSLARSAALLCAPLRSFVRSLTHSGAHGKEIHVHELIAPISYSIKPMCDEAMGGQTEPPVEIQGHKKTEQLSK